MKQNTHYIQWENGNNKTLEAKITEVMKHWQVRYELGSAVLLVEDSVLAQKLAEKQWRKLSRQLQAKRELNSNAQDILSTTRTISRMQRVKFSSSDPTDDPDAKFYVLTPARLESLPLHCYTLYSIADLPPLELLKLLPSDSLVVAYSQRSELAGFYSKGVLEEKILTQEAKLTKWLRNNHIEIDILATELEKANEALDTLLSSSQLQSEFLQNAELYLNLVQLAQPIKLPARQVERLAAISQLEHHVRVLSPAFLSDHIIDSQGDDTFLLRDPETGKILTFETFKNFISAQKQAGRTHLAKALEQKAGYVHL
jgi:hypothetical protein